MALEGSLVVKLDAASEGDSAVLANLLELYVHDLSEVFPGVEIGENGRFGYHPLSLYWTEPASRFAFLLRVGEKLAGFILATRGPPSAEDPEAFDIAEFFVLRGLRRSGVGRSAALLLWGRLPGPWTVRVSEGNLGALPFWSKIIEEHTGGRAIQTQRSGSPHGWRVFSFETPATSAVIAPRAEVE